MLLKHLFGDDIFISYSRADAINYAPGLANELAKLDFSCFLDQWGTPPGKELPRPLRRALARSAVLVLIGTERAARSQAVSKEIEQFVKTARPIIPIDFDGALLQAEWYPAIQGLALTPENKRALEDGNPSKAVISRIEKSFKFTRRNRRVRRTFLAAGLLLLSLMGVSVYASVNARRQQKNAEAAAQRALEQERIATTNAQRALEQEAIAKNQEAIAKKNADDLQNRTEELKKRTEDLRKQEELARQSAAEAKKQEQFARTNAAEAKKQQGIAEERQKIAYSRELASGAASLLLADPELSVLLAKEAAEVLPAAQHADLTRAESLLREGLLASHTQAVMRGHLGAVNSATFSPDGKFIITASADKTARVWDAATGSIVRELRLKSPVQRAAFSQSGKYILTVAEPDSSLDDYKNISVWSADGEHLDDLKGDTASFDRNSDTVVTVDSREHAEKWEPSSGRKELPPGNIKYRSTVKNWFSPGGGFVLTASRYETAEVWEARYGHAQNVKPFKNFERLISEAAVSNDGKLAATVSEDGEVQVWDVDKQEKLPGFKTNEKEEPQPDEQPEPQAKARTVMFSPNNELILVSMLDGTVHIREARTGKLVTQLKAQAEAVKALAISPDSKLVITGNSSNQAQVWELSTGKSVAVLRGHQSIVLNAAFSPDGNTIVTAGFDGTARVWSWESESWRLRPTALGGHDGNLKSAAFDSQGERVLATFEKNSAAVWNSDSLSQPFAKFQASAAVFSPDGKLVVTARPDHVARLWDATNGKVVAELRGHTDKVASAVFSPNGRFVLTASWDKTASVWDAATGRRVTELSGSAERFDKAVFSPDGELILTIGQGNAARIRETRTGKVRHLIEETGGLYGPASDLAAFSPNGESILIVRNNGATLWDAKTGALSHKLPDHNNGIESAAFSHDSKLVVVTDAYMAGFYEVASGKTVIELNAARNPQLGSKSDLGADGLGSIRHAVFSPDSKLAVITSFQGGWVLDIASQRIIAHLNWKGESGYNPCMSWNGAFSPDGKFVAIIGTDQTTKVFEAMTGKLVAELRNYDPGPTCGGGHNVSFSPDGKFIFTTSADDTARVWEWQSGDKPESMRPRFTLRGRTGEYSPDGKLIVTTSEDDTAEIWETSTKRLITTLTGHTGSLTSIRFSHDGQLIVTASDDGTAWVWQTATGRDPVVLKGVRRRLNSAEFSPDGRLVVTTGENGMATVWNVLEGLRLADFVHPVNSVSSARFSPDSSFILTTGESETAWVWKLPPPGNVQQKFEADESLKLRGHTGKITGADFSPDGNLIVTSSEDRSARVWEWQTEAGRNNPIVLLGHTNEVWRAAFSPDNSLVVTASRDATARLWDVNTGQSLAELTGQDGPVLNAAFSRDGKSILTVSEKGAQIYTCHICGSIEELLGRARNIRRQLTGEEAKKYLRPM